MVWLTREPTGHLPRNRSLFYDKRRNERERGQPYGRVLGRATDSWVVALITADIPLSHQVTRR